MVSQPDVPLETHKMDLERIKPEKEKKKKKENPTKNSGNSTCKQLELAAPTFLTSPAIAAVAHRTLSLYTEVPQRLVQVTLQHPLYPLDYSFSSIDEGWIVINLKNDSKVMKSTAMVVVDCEMVLCEDGTETLVKVCVVDHSLEVKLNELVKPDKEIIDYRTEITAKSMKLLSNGTILVGHSLHNYLRVLKLDLVRVVDTSYIFQSLDGSIHRRPSLNGLCQASNIIYMQKLRGALYNCLDDACAAMNLVLVRIKHGLDREFPISLVQEHMSKLLLPRIPNTVNNEVLHKIVLGDFKIELKQPSSRKGQGEKNYSAFVIFKNPQEADDAFENVQENQLKDTYGRPQKLGTFRLGTGMSVNLVVRKMATDDPMALQMDEAVDVSKKAKMDPKTEEDAPTGLGKFDTEGHLNEIEALSQQLKQNELEIESLRKQLTQKDFEITMLHKMVSSLKKRKKQTVLPWNEK
ncbi:Small RNA degrading nuclease 3, partial [Mucuna pruriens]